MTNDEVSLIHKLSHEDHDLSGLRMRIAENRTMDDDGEDVVVGGVVGNSVFDNFD